MQWPKVSKANKYTVEGTTHNFSPQNRQVCGPRFLTLKAMTAADRKRLEFKALSNTLTIEDVYYITLDSLAPYVEFTGAKVHTHCSDTEFIIKTTPGTAIDGTVVEPWVYIGKAELDAIRVYSYLTKGEAPEIREWNIN